MNTNSDDKIIIEPLDKQQVLDLSGDFSSLCEALDRALCEAFKDCSHKSLLLVCGASIREFRINEYFVSLKKRLGIDVIRFSNFTPNPKYESVKDGVKVLLQNDCHLIIAVGGGSAMDVAKCIKLYTNMEHDRNYLEQTICPNEIELWAMPTTAGTGSEATRFAVIYANGEKKSVAHESCIPSVVLYDPSVLGSLPEYQRKATMLDALCHAMESFWSVNSTEESRLYSVEAIRLIQECLEGYINNEPSANMQMLRAANIAGKAINITQTTAGHAMCYKLTTLYKISHGHAAALCVSRLFPYMLENTADCIDPRGEQFLKERFMELARVLGFSSAKESGGFVKELLVRLGLDNVFVNQRFANEKETAYAAVTEHYSIDGMIKEDDFELLRNSVNPDRLKNNPVRLSTETIDMLYHAILV